MLYTFADCELDTQRRTFRRAGHLLQLRPKVFDVLLYLLMHRHRVIDKQELCEQVWPEQFISDATIESTLRAVRQAVGDSGKAQRLIQTFVRHGYRFVADVTECGEERLAVAIQAVEEQPGAEPRQVGSEEAATVLLPAPGLDALLPEEQAWRTPGDPWEGESASVSTLGRADAEHRHLTVLCCGLVDTAARTTHRNLETLHEVIRAAHATCTAVVAHFEGYIAQYQDDGLLVYFGFPRAHEDDAQRAVRAGLAIVEAMQHSADQAVPLQVRVGIHTGPVVVGALGAGAGQVLLALGEVPQDAARLLARAAPQTVVLSTAAWHLVAGWFVGEILADQALPGMSQPQPVYRVLRDSGAQSRLDVAAPERLTPLVGRTSELAVLQERWAQARDGLGQMVLLSGEAGMANRGWQRPCAPRWPPRVTHRSSYAAPPIIRTVRSFPCASIYGGWPTSIPRMLRPRSWTSSSRCWVAIAWRQRRWCRCLPISSLCHLGSAIRPWA